MSADIPGWEGSIGPSPSQYGKPHVYARDVHSGAGNCVCGRNLSAPVHVQAAPGVPIPDRSTNDAPARLAELEAEVARLRAGESDQPRTELGRQYTPAEWIHRWNRATADERLAFARRNIEHGAQESRCFLLNHDARIGELEEETERLRDRVAELEAVAVVSPLEQRLKDVLTDESGMPARLEVDGKQSTATNDHGTQDI